MGQFYKAAKAADVASGKLRCVEVAGRRIALFALGDEIYALGDLCTHGTPPDAGRLSEGEINGDEVVCPIHENRFHIPTGEPVATARSTTAPSTTTPPSAAETIETIERYNVRVQDGDVEIEIE